MEIKFKKLVPEATTPSRSHYNDAGFDLTATSVKEDTKGNVIYGTGIAMEIPDGYVGLVFPRSSISKYGLHLTNCVGVIDAGYRGEITFKFKSLYKAVRPSKIFDRLRLFLTNNYNGASTCTNVFDTKKDIYQVGDRIGQIIIMPIPDVDWVLTEHLSSSDRGVGGYGSTGN